MITKLKNPYYLQMLVFDCFHAWAHNPQSCKEIRALVTARVRYSAKKK